MPFSGYYSRKTDSMHKQRSNETILNHNWVECKGMWHVELLQNVCLCKWWTNGGFLWVLWAALRRLRYTVCQQTPPDQRANERRVWKNKAAVGSCPFLYPTTRLAFIRTWKELLTLLAGVSIPHSRRPTGCQNCSMATRQQWPGGLSTVQRSGINVEALKGWSNGVRGQRGRLKLLFMEFCHLRSLGGMKWRCLLASSQRLPGPQILPRTRKRRGWGKGWNITVTLPTEQDRRAGDTARQSDSHQAMAQQCKGRLWGSRPQWVLATYRDQRFRPASHCCHCWTF